MKNLFFITTFFLPILSACQSIPINGKVINEEGKPVVGASVTIKHKSTSTVSDVNGLFTFQSSLLSDTLIVSAIGYQTTEEPNNERGQILIVLKRKITALSEVVLNTGYQELPWQRSTGSFEKVGLDLLNRKVSAGWLTRLQGTSSVYFDNRSVSNGAISIRGRSTIYANATPLIVVDNFSYDGDINSINPNDIESITILKDAAAASIWGVQAGNGVIVVTTKKGKFDRAPVFELNVNTTISAKPDLYYASSMSSSDFIDVEQFLYGNGFYDGDITNTYTWPPLSPVVEILSRQTAGLISPSDAAAQIDALRKIDDRRDLSKHFYRNAVAQQYSLSYSGGANNISYYVSAGYDRQSSSLVRNCNDRISFTSRTLYAPSKFFQFTAALTYSGMHVQTGNPAGNLTVGNGKNLYPYAQLLDDQNSPLPIVKDYRYSFIDTTGGGNLLDWKYRPFQELFEANNKQKQSQVVINTKASFIITKHFSADLLYQFQRQIIDNRNLYSQNTYYTRNLINRYYDPSMDQFNIPFGSILDQAQSSILSQSARAQVNYKQAWQSIHEVSAIAGAEIRQNRSSSSSARAYGYNDDILTFSNVNYVDNFPIYNGISYSQPIPNTQGFSEATLRYVSLYANAAYTYNRKYTATLSARKDASNLFGVASNQKWVPLWSSGLSWQIDKEKFYKSSLLPFLKFRITYGYSGNVDNTLSALTTIRYSSFALFTQQPYAIIENPPNPELRWEKISILNLAIDFSSQKDRISGSIEYYKKHGKDLIGYAPVDPTTGVRSPLLTFSYKGNVAAMKGSGVDVILNSQNLIGKFKWSTTFLLSYVSTKVTKYDVTDFNAAAFLDYGTAISPLPGKPLYSIFSYQWAGLDPSTGDPQGVLNGTISKDYNALTNVNVDQLIYNGSALPVFFGSLQNTFTWKNISLYAGIIYKLKYYFRRTSINYTSLFNNWISHSDYVDRWQRPGDEKFTNVPSMIYPNSDVNRDNFYSESEVLVEKGDHIRLQDISLSYTINNIKKNLPFRGWGSIQPYIYINNVGIIWKANRSDLDPDYFSGGYPLPRTISFGCKLNF